MSNHDNMSELDDETGTILGSADSDESKTVKKDKKDDKSKKYDYTEEKLEDGDDSDW